jgi:hypothetical protein
MDDLDKVPFSRREFLKLGSLGIVGLFSQPLQKFRDIYPDLSGRVAELKSTVYDRPSLDGKQVKLYWRDMILPITEVTVGDLEPQHNRIWYSV